MSRTSRERAAEGQRAQPTREIQQAAEAQRSAPRVLARGAVQLSGVGAMSPGSAARAVRAMQRRHGNAAVARAATQTRQNAPVVQAKLVVTQAGDRYEQEADRAAQAATLTQAQPDSVQCAARSPLGSEVAADAGMSVMPEVEAEIHAARGGGQPLPEGLRSHMETALGADFGGVRVHTGAHAHALNEALQARAFTTGRDIFFRQGEYAPGSAGGREVLAHELAHVVQQGRHGDTCIQRLMLEGKKVTPTAAFEMLTQAEQRCEKYKASVRWGDWQQSVKDLVTAIDEKQTDKALTLMQLHEEVMQILDPMVQLWQGAGVFWFESVQETQDFVDEGNHEDRVKKMQQLSERKKEDAVNKARFFSMLFETALRSQLIRDLIKDIIQEKDPKKYSVIIPVSERERGFIDAFASDTVNIEDLAYFPQRPRADRREEMTRGEHIAHVLYERRMYHKEKGDDPKFSTVKEYGMALHTRGVFQKHIKQGLFEQYHASATKFHTHYREEQGQAGGKESQASQGLERMVQIEFANGERQIVRLDLEGKPIDNAYLQGGLNTAAITPHPSAPSQPISAPRVVEIFDLPTAASNELELRQPAELRPEERLHIRTEDERRQIQLTLPEQQGGEPEERKKTKATTCRWCTLV